MDDRSPSDSGNRYENIHGANINFGTQSGNVTINYGTQLQQAEDPERKALWALLNKLHRELQSVAGANQEEAQAVEMFARQAAEEAAKPEPNKVALKITGESLKAAARNLLTVAPIAVEIAKVLLQIS